jgi:hypothetical protein
MSVRLAILLAGHALFPGIITDTRNTNVCSRELGFMSSTSKALIFVFKFIAKSVKRLVTRY